MGRVLDRARSGVVDCVVVDKGRHSNDVDGHVDRQDEKDALARFVWVGNQVIHGVDLEPFVVEHEVDFRVGGVAFGKDGSLSE